VFSRSAKKLSEELAKIKKDVGVRVNPEKPGKGNFIVSVNGEEVVALKALPRPFKALRELDLEEVAKKVTKKL
jgi:hypothetical protein